MPDPAGNTLSDFPPEEFTILAFCDVCGHQSAVDRSVLLMSYIIHGLPGRLRGRIGFELFVPVGR